VRKKKEKPQLCRSNIKTKPPKKPGLEKAHYGGNMEDIPGRMESSISDGLDGIFVPPIMLVAFSLVVCHFICGFAIWFGSWNGCSHESVGS
jgi:hypothetical protein